MGRHCLTLAGASVVRSLPAVGHKTKAQAFRLSFLCPQKRTSHTSIRSHLSDQIVGRQPAFGFSRLWLCARRAPASRRAECLPYGNSLSAESLESLAKSGALRFGACQGAAFASRSANIPPNKSACQCRNRETVSPRSSLMDIADASLFVRPQISKECREHHCQCAVAALRLLSAKLTEGKSMR